MMMAKRDRMILAHSACQQGRRYRLRRRVIDSALFCRWRPAGLSAFGPRSAPTGRLKLHRLLVSQALISSSS